MAPHINLIALLALLHKSTSGQASCVPLSGNRRQVRRYATTQIQSAKFRRTCTSHRCLLPSQGEGEQA